jgi:hypothetical protein
MDLKSSLLVTSFNSVNSVFKLISRWYRLYCSIAVPYMKPDRNNFHVSAVHYKYKYRDTGRFI